MDRAVSELWLEVSEAEVGLSWLWYMSKISAEMSID